MWLQSSADRSLSLHDQLEGNGQLSIASQCACLDFQISPTSYRASHWHIKKSSVSLHMSYVCLCNQTQRQRSCWPWYVWCKLLHEIPSQSQSSARAETAYQQHLSAGMLSAHLTRCHVQGMSCGILCSNSAEGGANLWSAMGPAETLTTAWLIIISIAWDH